LKGSRFNIFVPAPDGRDTILFNTLYGSISVLDDAEYRAAKSMLADTAEYDQTSSLFTQLVNQKHMVPDELDELSLVETRKRAGIRDQNTLEVIILPTLDCNFSCVYCYEDHRPSRMRPEAVGALKAWLSSTIPNYKVVMLYWFGGEPLLQFDTVLSVSRHVKTVAERFGKLAVLHVTTNGYLLTRTRAKELAESGIRDYQITLDGPANAHNRLRVLRDGGGTFDRVFRNVCTLASVNSAVKITLRINVNHTNIDFIPELLQSFPPALRPQLRIAFEPIFGDSRQSALCNISQSVLSEKLSGYSEQAASLGYDVIFGLSAIHPGKLVYCYAERESQFIFNFNGDVFKCTVCNFDSSQCVGHLQPDGSLKLNEDHWKKWVRDDLFGPRCRSCVYLPLCMGGCRKTRLQVESDQECCLVATNASYLLKLIALGGLREAFKVSMLSM